MSHHIANINKNMEIIFKKETNSYSRDEKYNNRHEKFSRRISRVYECWQRKKNQVNFNIDPV